MENKKKKKYTNIYKFSENERDTSSLYCHTIAGATVALLITCSDATPALMTVGILRRYDSAAAALVVAAACTSVDYLIHFAADVLQQL